MIRIIAFLTAALLFTSNAYALDLSSPDIATGRTLNTAQIYKGFGCSGDNFSPTLIWKDVPAGTLSFAVTVHDPDAPTGSGWWHWIIYDISSSISHLPSGIAIKRPLLPNANQGVTVLGKSEFGGLSPPPGTPHHAETFLL